MSLEEKLKLLPDRCGVYLFKDKKGKILYIGKALSLKKRVKSYFQKGQFSPRIGALVRRIEDVEWIVTESEAEAFLLESNLIKHHHPKYNIRFRDDKSYPYIKLSTNEEFPAVFLTRNPKRDKALYFGPYTNVKAAKKTLRLIHRLFPLRRCKDKFKTRLSPCLNFYIKECSAPCVGRISKKDYDTLVQNVSLFLQGHYQTLVSQLEEKMLEASKNLEFEKAAKIRDTIRAINQVAQTQAVTSFPGEDMDLIAVARNKKDACLMVFMIREGKVIDKNHFLLRINTQDKDEEILSSFIKQYYARTSFVPPQIIVPGKVEEKEKITRWLSSKKGEKVKITSPREKDKKRLLELAEENARFFLVQEKGEGEEEGLHQLKEYLGLSEIPFRIEGFDISNIAGEEATGAVVVFEEGRPKKSEYRKFTIKTVSKIDDFAMLNEVVRRRYKRVVEENKNLPQLILVDGGKGQVSACLKALKEIGLESIPVIGLAKEFEKVFTARENRSLDIPLNSAAMKLLQRIRDEAHRFAHLHHRKKREKKIE
ncbi:excinuclease ABC subunit UvrC, partial [Candidatus Aerophobetes bacterium]|nr:excinuclease ABC subunit UvrC [Candidatus Aerophobetes bacterium]